MSLLLALPFLLPHPARAAAPTPETDPRPVYATELPTLQMPGSAYQRPKPKHCTPYDAHGAVEFGKLECVKLALTHMDINDRNVEGDTPLHGAIHAQNLPVIRYLVRTGADIHLKDFLGRNAIDLAFWTKQWKLYDELQVIERETERLLEAADFNDVVGVSNALARGAAIGMRDIRLDTPLHKAAQNGFVEVARLLIRHGSNLEARNYLGETPLHIAALRNFGDFMQLLIEAGANVNAVNERRETPLDLAEAQSTPAILAMLKSRNARSGHSANIEVSYWGQADAR